MGDRSYQTDAIVAVRRAMAHGARRVVLVLPTGAGKTRVAAEIARLAVARGRRVLWLAHRRELVVQARSAMAARSPTIRDAATTLAASIKGDVPDAPVTVAQVQTLLARGLRPEADLIVVDECHRAIADGWASLVRDYAQAHVLGLTATPERGDGRGLGDLFDDLVVGATVRELTELGYLVPCEVLRPPRLLRPAEIAATPVEAYLEHGEGRRCVVFARSVELARGYTAAFAAAGVDAALIHGETPEDEREATLARGPTVVCNVGVLTEGWDDCAVSMAILARGCGTQGLYRQMVGRILRPHPGKRSALLVDLRGVSHEHGRPDDDVVYSLHGRGIRYASDTIYCPVCGQIRSAGEGCSRCGWQPDGDGIEPDRVVGVPLEKYAAKRRESDEERRATLDRWIAIARARGYKPGWAIAKYRAVYGTGPPRRG